MLFINDSRYIKYNKKTTGVPPAVKKQYPFLFADNDLP
jgi:hypothetical protein